MANKNSTTFNILVVDQSLEEERNFAAASESKRLDGDMFDSDVAEGKRPKCLPVRQGSSVVELATSSFYRMIRRMIRTLHTMTSRLEQELCDNID